MTKSGFPSLNMFHRNKHRTIFRFFSLQYCHIANQKIEKNIVCAPWLQTKMKYFFNRLSLIVICVVAHTWMRLIQSYKSEGPQVYEYTLCCAIRTVIDKAWVGPGLLNTLWRVFWRVDIPRQAPFNDCCGFEGLRACVMQVARSRDALMYI